MTGSEPNPVQASFVTHVNAFHGTLPPEEQTMLAQVFALAKSASQQSDVQGFASPLSPGLFEIEDYSFDIEQVLGIGSASSGAGAGRVTLSPSPSVPRKTGP